MSAEGLETTEPSVQLEVAEQDRRVHEFLHNNTNLDFIGKDAFDECYYKIKTWIDIQVLVPFLKRYHLLTEDDEHYLTNLFTSRVEKFSRLVYVADKGGRNGYMLLYMCLLESIGETRGHFDAADELDKVQSPADGCHSPMTSEICQTSKSPAISIDNIVLTAKARKEMKRIISVSSSRSSEGPEDNSDPMIDDEISKLQDEFSGIASCLLHELDNKKCDVDIIRSRITVLPDRVNKEIFLSLPIDELTDKSSSIHTLFNFLNAKVWNFVDYHLLKFMVDTFGSEDLKIQLSHYIEQLERFLGSTPVSSFITCWEGHNAKPSTSYSEFEVKFVPDHNQAFTMQTLNEFRKQIQTKFLPPLSEYAVLHYRHRLGCFIVTWILPFELAKQIEKGIIELKHFEMFEKYFVEYVSVHNIMVYDVKANSSKEPEMFHQIPINSTTSAYSQDKEFNRQDSTLSASKLSVFEDSYLSRLTPIPARDLLIATAGELGNDSDEEMVFIGEMEDKITIPQLLRSKSFISVSFNPRQDEMKKHDNGCFPSIVLNNSGVVVEVCHKKSTHWMLYRVGKLKEDIVDWNESLSLSKPSKCYYGTGSYPQISMNDKNTLVEVHGGEFKEKCYYRVGKVVPLEGVVTWSPSRSFEKMMGHYPGVAINNHNYVIVVYQRDILTKTICYRIGRISEMKCGEIVWVKGHTLKRKAENFSIAINNDNMVVLSYQTYNRKIYYLVGRLDFVRREIMWGDPVFMFSGCFPNISMNDRGHVVLVHQSMVTQNLFCSVGRVIWEMNVGMICWSQKKHKGSDRYGKGQYPSICINGQDRVVEAHMAEFPRNHQLHYYNGQISLEHSN